MRSIKMKNGFEIDLDGDLLQIVESLFREVAVRKEFEHTYHDMKSEIETLVDQMNEEERRTYLVEALFLNSVTYENERIDALMKNLETK
jgi:hypothetical protein